MATEARREMTDRLREQLGAPRSKQIVNGEQQPPPPKETVPETPPPPDAPDAGDSDEQDDERTVAWSEHRKVKSEAQTQRARAKAAEAERDALRAKIEANREKAEAYDRLQTEIRDRDVKDAFIKALSGQTGEYATASGEVLYRLYKDQIEASEDGKTISNLKTILKAARAEVPQMFGPRLPEGSADTGQKAGAARKGSHVINDHIRHMAGRKVRGEG